MNKEDSKTLGECLRKKKQKQQLGLGADFHRLSVK